MRSPRGATSGAERPRRHEPAVRRRIHAEPHRGGGRSPAGYPFAGCGEASSCTRRCDRRPAMRPGPRQTRQSLEPAAHAGWIKALVRDLTANRGKSLVIAGDTQPAEVHALAHFINQALGNIGKTVEFFPRADAGPADQTGSLGELARAIEAGAVETLLILGGNPAYDAPAELDFARVLASEKTKLRIHLGLYDDETARLCHWHIPQAHLPGIVERLARRLTARPTIQQPLIAPLYKGRSAHEMLALLAWASPICRRSRSFATTGNATACRAISRWHGERRSRQGGSRERPQSPRRSPRVKEPAPDRQSAGGEPEWLEIVFRPDPTIWDGRFANNGWLQELPKPLMKAVVGERGTLEPGDCAAAGDRKRRRARARRYRGRPVQIPAWIMPGQADQSITVFLGHGRRRAGRVGTGVGVDVFGLRQRDSLWFGSGLEVKKTGEHRQLAAMHHHFSMEGRDLIRAGTPGTVSREQPDFAQKADHEAARRRELDRRALAAGAPRARRGECMGHGDRFEHVHRLRGVRGRLPGREQHSGGGPRAGAGLARDALAAHRSLFRRRGRSQPQGRFSARSLHALREGAVRGGLPDRRRRRTAPRGSTR